MPRPSSAHSPASFLTLPRPLLLRRLLLNKQDQIHASIVSTLLALMDGLDSRGQVVVIGATNRPDAIDAGSQPPLTPTALSPRHSPSLSFDV